MSNNDKRDELRPVDDATAEKMERAVSAIHGNKGPYSYEEVSARNGTAYRIRDANDNAVGRSYVEDNAKLIVEALNAVPSATRTIDQRDFDLVDAVVRLLEAKPAALVNLPEWDALSLAVHAHPAAHIDSAKQYTYVGEKR